jgi:hypothetical protein
MARPLEREALAGRVFGRLTAVEPTRLGKQRAHLCRCACGASKAVRDYYLLRGVVNSCGCLARGPAQPERPAIEVGATLGLLTVLELLSPAGGRGRQARVRCACGAERVVQIGNLRSGTTRSCGCQIRAVLTSHGLAGSPEYAVWGRMIHRCENPCSAAFAHYGGRGINVCARWHDPSAFLADMGNRPSDEHSLDRIDVDGGYWCGAAACPDCGPAHRALNCRWTTVDQQARNTRRALALCESNGVPKDLYLSRLREGWDARCAATTPPGALGTNAGAEEAPA